MDRLRIAFTCVSLGLLAACGGGGDSPAASGEIAKYAGDWRTCVPIDGVLSLQVDVSIRPTSGDSAILVENNTNYDASPNCSGEARAPRRFESTITLAGRSQVEGETVDKVDVAFISPLYTARPNTSKRIMLIRPNGKLHGGAVSGEPPAGLDAQGYPAAIDTKYALTRL